MGTVRSFHRLNQNEIDRILQSRNGPVARDLIRRGIKVESAAKRRISASPKRVNTGRLRSSITHQLGHNGLTLVMRVGTNVFYARWVHDGTGIYGPRGTRIVPKTAKVLRWTTKSGVFYARSVKGMQPNKFLKDALSAARG